YLTPKNVDSRRRFADGSSERPDLVEITRTPDVLLQAHLMIAIDHKDTMKSFSNDFFEDGNGRIYRIEYGKSTVSKLVPQHVTATDMMQTNECV
ncbi:unnamed protein product, partial [Rotaria magnacalcarata]